MKDYKKAIVITNGNIADYGLLKKHIKNYDFGSDCFAISADGGAGNALRLNIVPDLVVGDMDSISSDIKSKINSLNKNVEFISEPPQKDETDTQLALQVALKYKAEKIIIVGALGDRADHSFANIILLSSPFLKEIDVRILTENSEIFVIDKPATIKSKKNKLISLFSLTDFTYFRKTEGLQYALKDEKLYFSPVRGISNVFTEDKAFLDINGGKLLIIKEI